MQQGKQREGRLTFLELCEVLQEVTNTTGGTDCVAPERIKRRGVGGLREVLSSILNEPMHQWLEECKAALHMAFEKGVGDELNKHTRPIKVRSALLRLKAKMLNKQLHCILSPKHNANRQFATYKGASAVGLCKLLHTPLHVGLNRGQASVAFLDIAGAFDEVAQSLVQTIPDRLAKEVCREAQEILEFCCSLRTYVVTAFGLSEWYK